MKILIDETLPLVNEIFDSPQFTVSFFNKAAEHLTEDVDAIICRAHTKINQHFFNGFKAKLVATATSGSDHLDKTWLDHNKVKWVDAIGSNARSVSDYVLHLLFHKHISLTGKMIGIIGVGHVGNLLNKTLLSLGFQTVTYDPPRAEKDPSFQSASYDDLFKCDALSLHIPLNLTGKHKTLNFIDNSFLKKCKENCLLINSSRGEVIKESALLKASHLQFCLDVFCNEPSVNPNIIKKSIIATPHIAGHAIEAKQRAMILIHKKTCDFFQINQPIHRYSHLIDTQYQIPIAPLSFNYDPKFDTIALKQNITSNKFIHLRKAHTFRHELNMYKQPANF